MSEQIKGIKKVFLTVVAGLLLIPLISQSYTLQYQYLRAEDEAYNDHILETKARDSIQILSELNTHILSLISNAYLEASLDSLYFNDNDTAYAQIHIGPKYQIAQLKISEEDGELLADLGYRPDQFVNRNLQIGFISELFERILVELENNGYPFAKLGFSEYQIYNGQFKGDLLIEKGNYITLDSINTFDLNLISKSFLHNYLQLEKGSSFNRKRILEISDKIQNLPFLELSEKPNVSFYGDKSMVNLKLNEKTSSRFDFIVGVLPGNNETRFTISGDLNVELMNQLNQGEQFLLNFERLKPETQKLDVNFKYPYIYNLPFGFDTEFNFFRNENKNRDLNFSFGVLYQFSTNNYLKAFWNRNSSRLIQVDTAQIISRKSLPSRLDVSLNNVGFELQFQDLDYLFNPRQGYQARLRISGGQKTILPNNQITSIQNELTDFSLAYDTLSLNTYQFRTSLDASYFFPIAKRSTILSKVQIANIFSEERSFENEFTRLGGNKSLRGFDEESISASFYSIFTLEYRLLLGRNSFLSAFTDYGIRKNEYESGNIWDRPFGFGAGFSLETGAGIFGISIAVGSEKSNPIDFRNTKTHMGFLSLF